LILEEGLIKMDNKILQSYNEDGTIWVAG